MQPTLVKLAAERFPGLADLIEGETPEPVQAHLWDGRLLDGELIGFFTADEQVEIHVQGAAGTERFQLADSAAPNLYSSSRWRNLSRAAP